MRRFRGRRRSVGAGASKAEYLWVTGQVSAATALSDTTVNNILVQGADWERGGADARETCTLVRVIAEMFWSHSNTGANPVIGPMLYALLVQDEDEAAIAPTAIASNGDERYLSFGYIPSTTQVYDATNSVAAGYRRIDCKQKVRLGNNNEVRLMIRNADGNEDRAYSLMTRCLLRLSR